MLGHGGSCGGGGGGAAAGVAPAWPGDRHGNRNRKSGRGKLGIAAHLDIDIDLGICEGRRRGREWGRRGLLTLDLRNMRRMHTRGGTRGSAQLGLGDGGYRAGLGLRFSDLRISDGGYGIRDACMRMTTKE